MSTHRRWLNGAPVEDGIEDGVLNIELQDFPGCRIPLAQVGWDDEHDGFTGVTHRGDLPEDLAFEIFPDAPLDMTSALMTPVMVDGQVSGGGFVRFYTAEQHQSRELSHCGIAS